MIKLGIGGSDGSTLINSVTHSELVWPKVASDALALALAGNMAVSQAWVGKMGSAYILLQVGAAHRVDKSDSERVLPSNARTGMPLARELCEACVCRSNKCANMASPPLANSATCTVGENGDSNDKGAGELESAGVLASDSTDAVADAAGLAASDSMTEATVSSWPTTTTSSSTKQGNGPAASADASVSLNACTASSPGSSVSDTEAGNKAHWTMASRSSPVGMTTTTTNEHVGT